MGEWFLGIYSSVAAPVLIVQMCAQYIYAPLLTRFAEYLKAGDMRGFLRLVFKVSIAIFALALVFGLLFALVGEPVLVLIFGSSIAPYAYLIVQPKEPTILFLLDSRIPIFIIYNYISIIYSNFIFLRIEYFPSPCRLSANFSTESFKINI